MQMAEGLDTGDSIDQVTVPIGDDETGGSLFDKLMKAGADQLILTMDRIGRGEAKWTPQPEESPTPYAKMLTRSTGLVDWTKSAVQIERMIRALDPWPGTYTFWNGQKLSIVEAEGTQKTSDSICPGKVHVEQNCMYIETADAMIRVLRLQLQGKKCMEAKAFLLGNHILAAEFAKMGVTVDNEHPDYVVIAFDTELDYAKMCAVCDAVRAGLPYIATHPDYNCPTETGFIPDIRAIIAFIKASTGREPDLIIGKPYGGIVRDALTVTGLRADQLAMCGDRLYTDIATGVNFGMTSILVMSGETTWEDREKSDIKPHLTFDRLSSMIPYLEKI
jgi:NagD protein